MGERVPQFFQEAQSLFEGTFTPKSEESRYYLRALKYDLRLIIPSFLTAAISTANWDINLFAISYSLGVFSILASGVRIYHYDKSQRKYWERPSTYALNRAVLDFHIYPQTMQPVYNRDRCTAGIS